MASSGDPPEDPLNTSSCLLPPSYFTVSEGLSPPHPRPPPHPQPPPDRSHEALVRSRPGEMPPEVERMIQQLLTRQATNFTQVTGELQRERQRVTEREAEIQAMRQKIIDTEAAAAKRLELVCADYERRLNVHETLAGDALRRFEEERDSWLRRANEEEAVSNKQLEEARASLASAQEANAELSLKLRDTSAALERTRQEVERLQVFQSWEQDRREVLERCTQMEETAAAADAASGLKQQRLDALQTILSLQEAELARHGSGEELEALQGLVGRWREKVFALLVQAESARQVAAQDRRQWTAARAETARELERSRGVATQLELKLSVAQAELSEERARLQQITYKYRDAEVAAAAAVKDRDAWRDAVSGLRGSVEAAVGAMAAQERQLSVRALGPLAASERRLEALTERLPVLKAQLKRLRAREALEQARTEFEGRESELRRELAVVREDRDRLARHMEQDADERAMNERGLRSQYEAEMVSLEKSAETLRLELAVKSESLERTEEERASLAAVCDSLQEEQRRLQEEVAALEAARESAVSAATAGLFAEHVQQMRDLQAALDETRREHNKAVLTLRQTERDLERSRAERAGEAAALEERWQRRAADLEAELARVTAEANLLRATVRQEGLLRTHAAARPAARAVEFAEEAKEGGGQSSPHKAPEEFQPHLVNLIEEVRSLVRSVETSELYGTDEDDEED